MRSTRWFVLSLVVALPCLGALAADEPGSAAVKAAKARFDMEKKTLDEAYATGLKASTKTYISALNTARKAALEGNDLDEAQRIGLEVKELEEKLKAVEPPPLEPLPPVLPKLTAKEVVGKKFWYSFAPDRWLLSFDNNGTIRSPNFRGLDQHKWTIDKAGQLVITQHNMGQKVVITADAPFRAKNGLFLGGKYVIDDTAKYVFFVEQK